MNEIEKLIQEFKSLESSVLILQFAQFIIWAVIILFLGWLARRTIVKSIEDNAMRYRAKKIARFATYVLIILLAIITFSGNVRYFTVTIGFISAGIAFALQEVILSIAGWVAIFGSTIYKTGDRIEINGVKGDVIDIGVTKTTLMEIGEWIKSDNYSGRIVQVSNASVFKGNVHNYSTDFPFVWDEIVLPLKYGSDLELAKKIIGDIAKASLTSYANFAQVHWKKMVKKYLIENAKVDPLLTISLNDNWIEFNLRFVVDYKNRRSTKHQLFMDIYRAIEQTEGKVALASATFEVVGLPELKVDLKDKNE